MDGMHLTRHDEPHEYQRHPIGDHHAVRAALGLAPKAKLPINGLPPRIINGWKVWVDALPLLNPTRHKRSRHRAKAQCPSCQQVMSAGRMHQHRCFGG